MARLSCSGVRLRQGLHLRNLPNDNLSLFTVSSGRLELLEVFAMTVDRSLCSVGEWRLSEKRSSYSFVLHRIRSLHLYDSMHSGATQ